jgi:HEAT repeat protein
VAQEAAALTSREALNAPLTQIEASQMREKAIAVLESAAFDPWAMLRANAIEGLGAAPARAEPIVRAGLADENPGVRYVAAITAGQLGFTSVRDALTSMLDDPDESVQSAAIFALVKLGDEPDRTPLARHLLKSDARVRANAAFVLGELGDSSAEPMLRDAGKRLAAPGGDPTIGPGASRLLRLHMALALAKLGDKEMVQTLRAALYPSAVEEIEGAVLAAQMLGELRDEGSLAQLVRMVEYRTDGREDWRRFDGQPFLYPIELRLAAATSLAKMGQPDGVYVGLLAEREATALVRSQIAFLYGAVGGPPASRKLAAMLEDPDPAVRVAAAANLVRTVGGTRGVGRGG